MQRDFICNLERRALEEVSRIEKQSYDHKTLHVSIFQLFCVEMMFNSSRFPVVQHVCCSESKSYVQLIAQTYP